MSMNRQTILTHKVFPSVKKQLIYRHCKCLAIYGGFFGYFSNSPTVRPRAIKITILGPYGHLLSDRVYKFTISENCYIVIVQILLVLTVNKRSSVVAILSPKVSSEDKT